MTAAAMSPSPMNMTDYEETYRTFRLNVPERFNFTTDVVEKWAADPARVALVVANVHGTGIREYTFAELSEQADRFAGALARRGIVKGDRVLVMLPRVSEWFAALLGMFKMGVLPVPTTPQCTARDLLFRIGLAEAVAVVTDAANAPKFDEILGQCPSVRLRCLVAASDALSAQPSPSQSPSPPRPLSPLRPLTPQSAPWECFAALTAAEPPVFTPAEKTRSDDPMLLYFTSGTVSHPKMVLHTQASYGIAHEITARFWQDLQPTDLHWTMTDTGWAKAAWGCLFGQWTLGARVFVHNSPRFEPKITLDLLERAGVTTFCAPPTVYRILVHEDLSARRFPTLRHCVSAGEPLNPEIIHLWKAATGATILDGYGQTETVNVLANFRCMPNKPGSMGKPTPGYEVAVIDDHGNPVPAGEEGQVAIKVRPQRPVGLFAGYWKDEAGTRGAYVGDWYCTGDKARVDEDGYFWFIGRNDDVIITSGYRIGPFEVESALVEHPAVREAAVVASPDADRGEVVKAFVILTEGHEPSEHLALELQNHVRKVTAPYKHPRKIEFVTELPKTISGKIRRGELKQRERGGVTERPRPS